MPRSLAAVGQEVVVGGLHSRHIEAVVVAPNVEVDRLVEDLVPDQQRPVGLPLLPDLEGADTLRVLGVREISRGDHDPRLDRVQGGGEELLEIIFDIQVFEFGDVEICDVEEHKWFRITAPVSLLH